MRQILTNLVGNAVKFTARGIVTVSLQLDTADDDCVVPRFEVQDTGIGIDLETLDLLFQPFSQAEAGTSRRYGGTGLGLVICKRLAELMGGEIGVSSEPGVGSTFWFTCRLKRPLAGTVLPTSRHEPPVDAAWRAAQRVLVVDDLAANRTIIQGELTALGLESSSVDDPRVGLDVLRGAAAHGRPYTFVLLDYRMLKMSGLEAAQAISADPLLTGTSLVLLASGFEDAQRREAEAAGIGAILDKPVRRGHLMQVLHRLAAPGGRAAHLAPAATWEADRPRPMILVVEDSQVNQRVAIGLLEKLGYAADVAKDGLEGLAALERREYAAVLMDCLMPEMDGYTATAELRRREAHNGGRRTPVIALTASARPVDRQRCLEAGMDDFLSKPIRGASLEAVLGRWTADRDERADVVDTADEAALPVADPAVQLDRDALQPIWELEELGRPGLFDEMLDLFREGGSERLLDLRSAVSQQDAQLVYRLAHTMKGEAMAWGATDLVATSREIEERSSDGSTAELERLTGELERLFRSTLAALDALRPTPA